VGVEPNTYFSDAIEREKNRRGVNFETHLVWKKGDGGDDLDIVPASFDHVIATHVLCSVDNIPGVLKQVERALKSGGRFLFMEHTWHPNEKSLTFLAQYFLAPVFQLVGNGCHFRKTWEFFVSDSDSFATAAAKLTGDVEVIASAGGGFALQAWTGQVKYFKAPIGIPVMVSCVLVSSPLFTILFFNSPQITLVFFNPKYSNLT